jgi:hypothetical protein
MGTDEHAWSRDERGVVGRPVTLGVCAVLGIVVGAFSYLNRGYELDDALIYYRYIRNCLSGHGLVYNVGEYFNALTSPLHVYVSLAACGLFGQVGGTMIVLSAVLTSTMAILLFIVYTRVETRWPLILAGAMLIAVSRYFYSVYGMETPLFLALCAAALLLYERRSTFALGIVGALLMLTRGEGIFLLAAIVAVRIARGRPLPRLRELIVPAALLGGCVAFNLAYYGSVLPHTLLAKTAQGRSGLWGGRWLFLDLGYHTQFFAWSRTLVVVSVGLALLGAVRLGRRDVNVVVLTFLALLAVFYIAINVPNYHWYYAPFYAFGCMYVGLGLAAVSDRIAATPFPGSRFVARLVPAVAAVGILGWNAQATATHPVSDDVWQRNYEAAGKWIEANTPAEATIAMVEVGIVGYHSNRRVVDILGLVTPGNAELLGERRFDEWLLRADPDFILVHRPLTSQERGVIAAVRAGRYRPSRAFDHPSLALLERVDGRSPGR